MKRFIALLMAIIMCSSLAGCGTPKCSIEGCKEKAVEDTTYEEPYCSNHLASKKSYELAKNAYDMIAVAYTYSEWIGNDVIAFFAYAAAHNITEDEIWSYCFMVDTFDTGNYLDFLYYRFNE